MDDQAVHSLPQSLCELLDLLDTESQEISFWALKQLLGDKAAVSAEQWRRVASCSACWMGRWESAWMFSPALAPDETAVAEFEGWRQIWNGSRDVLLEQSPELQAELTTEQRLQSLRHTRLQRDEYNRSKPGESLSSILYSQTAYVLNKLGFNTKAIQLYIKHLYPYGTVGRTSACGK
jgi:hypothetical protein